ncbi:FMN-binding protein [Patescibacteria group bacterium]|nr:FMN-binding protein [Patescibacteria group bacterium]
MKKTFIAGFVVVSFVAYAFLEQVKSWGFGDDSTLPPSRSNSAPNPNLTTLNSGSSPKPQTAAGHFKNGQYTGDSTDAFYGNVQVRVTISSGKITNVQFLDYPQDRDRSLAINTVAMPQLTSEAIQAQSANVDVVSGATATSQAFVQSLQSALNQAQ